jgi:hypothetical protein
MTVLPWGASTHACHRTEGLRREYCHCSVLIPSYDPGVASGVNPTRTGPCIAEVVVRRAAIARIGRGDPCESGRHWAGLGMRMRTTGLCFRIAVVQVHGSTHCKRRAAVARPCWVTGQASAPTMYDRRARGQHSSRAGRPRVYRRDQSRGSIRRHVFSPAGPSQQRKQAASEQQ